MQKRKQISLVIIWIKIMDSLYSSSNKFIRKILKDFKIFFEGTKKENVLDNSEE